jgi:hypothetical protein
MAHLRQSRRGLNSLPQRVSKLEAAERQLRQAIMLFFMDGDMIAVHTLAAASLQVLADLGNKLGIHSILKNSQLVREDMRKFVSDRINAAQNFFKHADRDAQMILDFYPDATPFYIIDAVSISERLYGNSSPANEAFKAWFMLNYTDLLSDGLLRDYMRKIVVNDPKLVEKEVALKFLISREAVIK